MAYSLNELITLIKPADTLKPIRPEGGEVEYCPKTYCRPTIKNNIKEATKKNIF